MRGWALVVALAGVVAACSFGALDGFSGGEGPDPGDAGTGTDAIVGADSSGGDSSGGSKRFCETLTQAARACADFDDGKLPLGFVKEEDNGGSATLVAEGKDGTGGLASVTTTNATSSASACLQVSLPGSRRKIVLEGDFRVGVLGTENFEILNLDTGAFRELGVSMTGTALLIEEDYVVDGGEQYRATPTTAIARDTWQRLRFVATVDGAVAHAELFVDGSSVGKHDAVASTLTDPTKLEIGDCALSGAQGWTVYYDNVVVYEMQ